MCAMQFSKARSFEQTFANAVSLIKQSEIDAGKDDGILGSQIPMNSAIPVSE